VRVLGHGAAVGQAVVADALNRVSAPAAGSTGAFFLIVALVTGWTGALVLAALGALVTGVAVVERRGPVRRPLLILVAATTACAAAAPVIGRAAALAILVALAAAAFVAVFALPRGSAFRFGVWCGGLAVWSLPWILPGMSWAELGIALVMFGAIAAAGWRLLATAGDALAREEEHFRLLFDSSPVATFEEDFTGVAGWLHGLREAGVRDLRDHLLRHPEATRHAVSLISIRRANPAAVRLIEARSPEDVADSFRHAERRVEELDAFVEQLVALWEGRREVALDLDGFTFAGRAIEAVLHWSVPVSRGTPDLGRVIVTISDITPRKQVEERLAAAVASNQRLLAFERAVVSCSKALLLGSDEDSVEVGLQALREAIGADRAYLAVNGDEPGVGPTFRVVRTASRPGFDEDDWIDVPVPWSEFPTALAPLSRGEPFRHLAGEDGAWRNRSVLAVPVMSGGRWVAAVGFADGGRRTEWSDEAVGMLEVVAPMLGTFWERDLTRRRLEELVRSKDRFVASVSHELRTPLAAVMGFSEELREHADAFEPHELSEMMELIAEQSREMADMVEDLLVAARADIGTISIRPQEVYLRAQAEVAMAVIGDHARRIRVVGGRGRAWADPTRTRQIIRNLLSNAVRYGGDDVVIETGERGDTTILQVWDSGAGLAPSEWERIFEPYERAHDRPTQPASIGLGLTVARQLARMMYGDLTYRTAERGSVFELTLPARGSVAMPDLPSDGEPRGFTRRERA
jgi:signal transduction histidine kinase/PAS domain-containing protein